MRHFYTNSILVYKAYSSPSLTADMDTSHVPSAKLDSRLLCNAMGHPGWPQSTNYNTPGMHF